MFCITLMQFQIESAVPSIACHGPHQNNADNNVQHTLHPNSASQFKLRRPSTTGDPTHSVGNRSFKNLDHSSESGTGLHFGMGGSL